ncbi:MAG: hypothetical protein DHS20C20_13110 [Ardenticatenaceae bacterium]|nr:MAG: hypothetical protein DHS20C20_13110 [Ardenticatenaceae bacterium]
MNSNELSAKIDKTALSITSLEEDTDEIAYWQQKTPQERLAALELMRQIVYGYDPATCRLQRVLTITQRA